MNCSNGFLENENIILRPLQEDDAEGEYSTWFNNEKVCYGNSHHVYPYTKVEAKNYISYVCGNKNIIALAIVDKNNNKHIGNISLQNVNYISRNAELSIVLGDIKSWGRGYGKQASFLICKHGFFELNLHRIYLGTPRSNVGMQKIALHIGMKEEGVRRDAFFKSGKFEDIIEFGIIKSEFGENLNEVL